MRNLVFLAALALPACATTVAPQPIVRTVTVNVPVPCPALVELGPEPAYVDTDNALRAAPDLFSRVKLLLQGRLTKTARLAQYAAAKASCE
jgi:hypothetical protein